MATSEHVGRVAGFDRTFEFRGEVTLTTRDGVKTVREFGHTAWGALARARATAGRTMTARRRATGFHADGFREATTPATFQFGFCGGR